MSLILSMPVLCIDNINISIEKDNKIITESINKSKNYDKSFNENGIKNDKTINSNSRNIHNGIC